MTAEGVFPKSAGDIAYASEINVLYNINKLKDVTPTLPIGKSYAGLGTSEAWDTDPTDLDNTTDESFTTATGVGVVTTTSGDKVSSIEWDLGANSLRTYLWAKFDFTEDSAGQLRFYGSVDGTTWFSVGTTISANSNYNQQVLTVPIKFRYFAIAVLAQTAGADTSTLKVYGVACY